MKPELEQIHCACVYLFLLEDFFRKKKWIDSITGSISVHNIHDPVIRH